MQSATPSTVAQIPPDYAPLCPIVNFGVLLACFICSRLFLKFCLGKMAKCMEFHDYLEAGVHNSVREGTQAASWAKQGGGGRKKNSRYHRFFRTPPP